MRGVMLVEVLIAVVVFSVGVLSLVKLNSIAARQSTEAEYRSLASLAVNDLVSRMWISPHDFETLQANFSSTTGNNLYTQWRDSTLIKAGLPNVTIKQPEVTVTRHPTVTGASVVLIRVYWKLPGKDWVGDNEEPRQYTVTTLLR